MEFDIIAVTKFVVGLGGVWLVAMAGLYLYIKHEQKKHRHNAS